MPARRMADSYTELLLPFGQNPEFLEAYTNASGGIRTGKYDWLSPLSYQLLGFLNIFTYAG